MKRKIITYTLLSVFLFSVIGVPLSLHYCERMQQKSVSACEICADELANINSSCCEDEQNNFSETISSPKSNCCQNEFVFNKIEDDFLINKSNVNFFSLLENVIHQVDLISPIQQVGLTQSFYNDSSPPFLINPEIHITNSALLI
ncbi:MAG: hypothetical protein IT276_15120 [Ignavibacteriaceae bacterium]|nr:hypothetical protein [Ignavibacteriaceae bacterium]HRN26272.1 hypothetical protein [Ignavibacteriaceae bacterium]HRP94090.1 hypothetical protein [Ignavibacteriaceae bacterium]HRQ53856.1 hypothetical protein [Ignavibacteriaceae bacterium]